jgi:hypothetical protein
MFKLFAAALLAGVFIVSIECEDAATQQVTQAQRDAIRASCRADFIANCSRVEPGGKDALECLRRNAVKLSDSCKIAIDAIAPSAEVPTAPVTDAASSETLAATPTPTAVQSQDDQLKVVRQACTLDDFMAHCSWIAPNSPELLLCLKANASALSPACQNVVQSLASTPADRTVPAAATSPPPAATAPTPKRSEPVRAAMPRPTTPAAAAAQKPSPQELGAIRAACRSDFMAHCPGVPAGGATALQCLQRNAARVSAPCQEALAALSQGAATSTAKVPAATTTAATSTVAPLGPMPTMRPREALAILRLCGTDQRALCPGIPLGGGRVISCLAENAAVLSPSCYSALSAAARR